MKDIDRKAEEFLKKIGIHPTEPIYWDLEEASISLCELMGKFAHSLVEVKEDRENPNEYELLQLLKKASKSNTVKEESKQSNEVCRLLDIAINDLKII